MDFGRQRRCIFLQVAAATILSIVGTPARALILHPDGEPNLAVWTDRPPADVVGRWGGNASCVAISSNCVVTTRHQGGGVWTSVKMAGVTYPIAQIWNHDQADLRLVRLYGANLADFVDIYEQTEESGRDVVIGGHGVDANAPLQTGGKTYGYEWGDYTSRALRFGTNKIENPISDSNLYGLISDVIVADFDGLGQGDSTVYESAPAAHDSGGGWFVKDGGAWRAAGLSRAVESHYEPGHEDDPDYVLPQSWFRDKDRPVVADADVLDAVRISSYAQWISNHLPGVLPGDLTGDDHVDIGDFSVFAAQWRRTDCQAPDWCLGSDSEPDGNVDALDLADFAGHWLNSGPVP